jgi:hypothetical protein
MKILLISTYELGRQPFGLASPAAWLRAGGHSVVGLDLTRETLEDEQILDAELICFYVPMHTATRLAAGLIPRVRKINAQVHLCFYGLYAPVNEKYLRGLGVGTILGGEFEEGLLSVASEARLFEWKFFGRAAGASDFVSEAKISGPGSHRDAGTREICARGDAQRRASRCGLDGSDARLQAFVQALPDRASV